MPGGPLEQGRDRAGPFGPGVFGGGPLRRFISREVETRIGRAPGPFLPPELAVLMMPRLPFRPTIEACAAEEGT